MDETMSERGDGAINRRAHPLLGPLRRWGRDGRNLIWIEVADDEPVSVTWQPETENELADAEAFFVAAGRLDWTGSQLHEILY
jgi:hypothetical protein